MKDDRQSFLGFLEVLDRNYGTTNMKEMIVEAQFMSISHPVRRVFVSFVVPSTVKQVSPQIAPESCAFKPDWNVP